LISVIELALIIAAFFTCGLSLLGILIVECCVKKTPVCRKCGCENSLVPMDSPVARKAMAS